MISFNTRLLTALLFVGNVTSTTLHAQSDPVIQVVLDQAKIVQLPENTVTIVLGNPMIVDVAMLQKNQKMVLTGKTFGETNLIALDKSGSPISEATIRVTASQKMVTVQRGLERESYQCDTRCQPTMVLGDVPRHMNDVIAQSAARSTAAKDFGK
jgi:Flp pilus assembly secretin CpaC